MIDIPPYTPPEIPEDEPIADGRTFYDPATGKGLYCSSQPIEMYPDWVEGRYDMTLNYFPGGVPTPRAEMTPSVAGNDPAAVDQVIAFTGFPNDVVVSVDVNQNTLPDGSLNFTPTTVGSYNVHASHPAYIPWRTIINVN